MTELDIAVIGAGPAGLTAATYGARSNLTVGVFEGNVPGGEVATIDEIENCPGFDEAVAGYDLAMKFMNQAEKFGAALHYSQVLKIQKEDKYWVLDAGDEGLFKTKAVIAATGCARRPLSVPGEKEYAGHGVSYCATCDGPFFKNGRILVVGGGDSAVQEALYLSKLSDKVTIIHRRDEFRAGAGLVNRLLTSSVSVLLSTTLAEIKGDGKKVTGALLNDLKKGTEYELPFDAVFGFVGNSPRTELFPFLEKTPQGFIKTNASLETSAAGIYAAGDVRDTVFRQIATAAADGALAAHAAGEYISENF